MSGRVTEPVPPLEPELERARDTLFSDLRRRVREQRVIDAMCEVRRDLLIPAEFRMHAYDDTSLPIGGGQTISQPRIVAEMTTAVRISPADRVLDVGTGSGYQAAIASLLASYVVSVEAVAELAERARRRLAWLGYGNLEVRLAGDVLGWPGEGPYDGIIVGAAAPSIPESLIRQLRVGGRMVLPVGTRDMQMLTCVTRQRGDSLWVEEIGPCQFVPLIGPEAWPG